MDILTYKTKGVCSREITIAIEGDIVKSVSFKSGCVGNHQGISKLVEGMHIDEVIRKLKGIDCDGKGTSCPDQLSRALETIIEKHRNGGLQDGTKIYSAE